MRKRSDYEGLGMIKKKQLNNSEYLFQGRLCCSILKMSENLPHICDALHDFVLFVQFRKRDKDPWRNVTFSKVAGFSLQHY